MKHWSELDWSHGQQVEALRPLIPRMTAAAKRSPFGTLYVLGTEDGRWFHSYVGKGVMVTTDIGQAKRTTHLVHTIALADFWRSFIGPHVKLVVHTVLDSVQVRTYEVRSTVVRASRLIGR